MTTRSVLLLSIFLSGLISNLSFANEPETPAPAYVPTNCLSLVEVSATTPKIRQRTLVVEAQILRKLGIRIFNIRRTSLPPADYLKTLENLLASGVREPLIKARGIFSLTITHIAPASLREQGSEVRAPKLAYSLVSGNLTIMATANPSEISKFIEAVLTDDIVQQALQIRSQIENIKKRYYRVGSIVLYLDGLDKWTLHETLGFLHTLESVPDNQLSSNRDPGDVSFIIASGDQGRGSRIDRPGTLELQSDVTLDQLKLLLQSDLSSTAAYQESLRDQVALKSNLQRLNVSLNISAPEELSRSGKIMQRLLEMDLRGLDLSQRGITAISIQPSDSNEEAQFFPAFGTLYLSPALNTEQIAAAIEKLAPIENLNQNDLRPYVEDLRKALAVHQIWLAIESWESVDKIIPTLLTLKKSASLLGREMKELGISSVAIFAAHTGQQAHLDINGTLRIPVGISGQQLKQVLADLKASD